MDRKIKPLIILLLLATCLLGSCAKDKPTGPDHQLPSDSRRILIACEGSLGNGNASLSVYLPEKDSIYNDIYTAANGQPLGDIFQSVSCINKHYFLVVNNSDKIVVLDSANWKQVAEIPVGKPRYILPVNSSEAYVSALFSNKLYRINTVNNTLEKTISLPFNNAEGMWLSDDGYAWICNWDTACNKVYKIHTGTDQVTDSVSLAGYAPQHIVADKEGKLWVLAGNPSQHKGTTLTRIDPASRKVLRTFTFPAGVEAIKPVFNSSRDMLYFIEVDYAGGTTNNGIYRMRYDDAALPATAWLPCSTFQYFWALGIDPVTGNIYVGDPKGFIQKGNVLVYRNDGTLLKQFSTGLGPGQFYFN
jgi:hypothetical protein